MTKKEKSDILKRYNWIKVKKYNSAEHVTMEEKFVALEQHHVLETTFLINKIRDLVKDLPTTD